MMDFTWVGPKVNRYYNDELGNYEFYKSFRYRGEEFQVGEFVVVVKGRTAGRIGMLMCLYHSRETRHRTNPFQGIVCWYTKAKKLDSKLNPTKIKFDMNNEVFENKTELDLVISLEHVVRKVVIIYATVHDPVYLIKCNKLDCYTYFSCRYKVESGRIVPLFTSNTGNYIVNGKLNFLPDFENLELVSEPNKPEFECVFMPPVEVTPTKQLTEIQNLKVFRSTRKASATSLDFCSSDEETEKEAVRSSRNRSKFLKLAVKSENSKVKPKLPIKRNSSVRRVLNISFESPTLSADDSPILAYSIVNSNVISENGLKMTLKLNDKSKVNVPDVLLTELDDAVINGESINADLQKVDDKIGFSLSTKLEESNSIRRSTRNTSRKSYADFTSPQFESPKKRSRKTNTDTPVSSNTPRLRSTRNNPIIETVANDEQCKISPIRSPSIKKAKEPLVAKTPRTSKPDLRKSLLRSSTKQLKFEESDEEDVEMTMKKRGKSVGTPKKTPGNTPRARAKMVRDGVITPSIQKRRLNVTNNGTPLQNARTQLHVSNVPTALPCREKEFSDILSFLEGKLLDGCGGCMYISGVPGTGKTATVTQVIRSLEESANDDHIPAFKYVNINGMELYEPRQAYVEIVKQLMGKTMVWGQAQTTLENKFVKSKTKSTPVILVVDEFDILCTKRQDVVYNLLDWPSKGSAQLMVITIANTMDLPERLLMGRVTSRLGLTRLTFQPYTHKQLQEIVTKRLTETDIFNADAIQLVARKVASVSGDARRALDICRTSAEIAELEGDNAVVTMNHVNQALSTMFTQPMVQAIKNGSKLEQLVLKAVVAEAERTGVEETTFDCIVTMFTTIAAFEGFKMVSNNILFRAVAKLGTSGLLLTDPKCNNLYQRIILNVSTDDVHYAMQNIF